jgi:hypothetical protein
MLRSSLTPLTPLTSLRTIISTLIIMSICVFFSHLLYISFGYTKEVEEVDQKITTPLELLEKQNIRDVSYADRKISVLNELRWMSKRLRKIQLNLNPQAALYPNEIQAKLQKAQLGIMHAQALEVSIDLVNTLQRQGIKSDAAYPQLLITLARALQRLNLNHLSTYYLDQALDTAKNVASIYEDVLISYLQMSQVKASVKSLKTFWQNYQDLCIQSKRPPSELARYAYGKALYFIQAHEEALVMMQPLAQTKNFKLRSQYFQAVIALSQGQREQAESLFKDFQKILQRVNQVVKQSKLTTSSDEENLEILFQSPTLIVHRISSNQTNAKQLSAEDKELQDLLKDLPPEVSQSLQMTDRLTQLTQVPRAEAGEVIAFLESAFHLSLARLSIVQNQLDSAWFHYKQIPNGTPFSNAAQEESIYVLRLKGSHQHVARLLDQVIAKRSQDSFVFQLFLWKAEAYAKANKIQDAKRVYSNLTDLMNEEVLNVQKYQKDDQLFPTEILAWIPDDQATRLSDMVQKFREAELAFTLLDRDTQETFTLLKKEQTTQLSTLESHPFFAKSYEVLVAKNQQLTRIDKKIVRLQSIWKVWDEQLDETRVENERGTTLTGIKASDLQNSVGILRQRIDVLKASMSQKIQSWPKLIQQMLQEQQKLTRLQTRLKRVQQNLIKLSKSTKIKALRKVMYDQAQIKLGPIQITYWIKEKASEHLEKAFAQRLQDLNPLRALSLQESSATHFPAMLDYLKPYTQPSSTEDSQNSFTRSTLDLKKVTKENPLKKQSKTRTSTSTIKEQPKSNTAIKDSNTPPMTQESTDSSEDELDLLEL